MARDRSRGRARARARGGVRVRVRGTVRVRGRGGACWSSESRKRRSWYCEGDPEWKWLKKRGTSSSGRKGRETT